MADDRIDEALDRLHATGDEFGGGLANHGPMVVEALARLGHVDEVPGWVRRYVPALEPYEGPPVRAVEGDWREVLRHELATLGPGAAGSAGHGAIRTAHAVALLEEADTPVRRMELARALAFWRSSAQVLPAGPPLAAGTSLVDLSGRERPPGGRPGLIDEHLRSLGPIPTPAEGAAVTIEEIVTGSVRVLAGTRPSATIPLVHAVTTPVALAVLDPYLPPGLAVAQAWRVAAALVLAYGDVELRSDPVDVDAGIDADTAVGLAVESGDEHAIKFAAAAAGARPAVVAEVARRLR